jgi:hypothetical protein
MCGIGQSNSFNTQHQSSAGVQTKKNLECLACAPEHDCLFRWDDYFAFEVRDRGWVWISHPVFAVKKFRYLFDPLCLACCACYALNRWGLKPHTHIALFRFWFNDFLLMPCALPPLLFVYRWLGLRNHDAFPTELETVAHLVLWSVLFEVVGPHLMHGVTGDFLDVVAYAAGAVLAFGCWHREQLKAVFVR